MVTHRFPLEDIATAFRVLRDREGDPLKVVILPGSIGCGQSFRATPPSE